MTRAPHGSRHLFVVTAVITGVAAFFYLTMTTGSTATLVEGRIFYFGHYFDWLITTPLLLLDLAPLALPNWRRNLGPIAGLIALDVSMILTGLLAGKSTSEFARDLAVREQRGAGGAPVPRLHAPVRLAAQSQPGQSIFAL